MKHEIVEAPGSRAETGLSPIMQQVVEEKRKRGMNIHVPGKPQLGVAVNEAHRRYINQLFDAVIEQHIASGSKKKREHHIFFAVFADGEEASKEKLKFFHNVTQCHLQVITYCERVLQDAGKPLPHKPTTMENS